MKAIIFSDSHRNFAPMTKAMEAEGKVNQIIHAGDVHSDVEDLIIAYSQIPVAFVKGNNDFWLPDVPEDRVFDLAGVRIFLTHGHQYGVKYTLAKLCQKATELGADIAVFGHTHVPHMEKVGKVTLFNPGAAAKGYGVLEINDGKFSLTAKKL